MTQSEPRPPPLARGAASAPPRDVPGWITRIRAGDAEAFDRLYDCYHVRLWRYLLVAAGGDEDLAAEANQDAWLRIVRALKPLPDEGALWRWLARVARTALFDLWRKRARRDRRIGKPLPLLSGDEAMRCEGADLRLLAALDAGLARLDPEERELLEAFHLQGVSQSDLACRYGTTRKAIESRLARLRVRLRPQVLEALRNAP